MGVSVLKLLPPKAMRLWREIWVIGCPLGVPSHLGEKENQKHCVFGQSNLIILEQNNMNFNCI